MNLLKVYTKEFSYNLKLAYPIIIGMVGHTLVGFVDNAMVGQLGTSELAAISLGNSFIFLAMSFGIGFSTAITPLIAESSAKNNDSKTKMILSNGILICSILGIILTVIVLITKPIIYYMGQSQEVVNLAYPYITWTAISLFPLIVFQSFKQFSDGLSFTKIAMISTVIANLMNVIINYILIYGKFGFPRLELVGAGIGTLISRISMVLIIILLIKINPKINLYIKNFSLIKYSSLVTKKIINLGYPSALQMMFEVGFFISGIWVCGIIGTNYQAANQIALNLSTISYMVAMGLSVTAMIRVGNQFGKLNIKELKFENDLHKSDLLISFSSTTIEEALRAKVPVGLFSLSSRYRHINNPKSDFTTTRRNPIYHLNKESLHHDLTKIIKFLLKIKYKIRKYSADYTYIKNKKNPRNC